MPQVTPHDDPALRSAQELADAQGGVVSRRQLYAAGVTRWMVRGHVRAGRWSLVGDQSVCLHNGEIERRGHWHAAVFQGGPRACLDGVTSLEAAGLERFTWEQVRVSVPRGARIRRTRLYDIRQTRRLQADDVIDVLPRRTRPAVAAVRAALWARSDRQAVLVVTMAVQQRLVTADQLAVELLRIRRDRRRRLLHDAVRDLLGGAHSLGEIDVAAECRRRGLPPPSRQVVRRGRGGRYYLDVMWEQWGVVVEIDGIQHAWAERVVDDALRHNHVALQHSIVLRLPLLGLRVAPDEFFAQIGEALAAAGCPEALQPDALQPDALRPEVMRTVPPMAPPA